MSLGIYYRGVLWNLYIWTFVMVEFYHSLCEVKPAILRGRARAFPGFAFCRFSPEGLSRGGSMTSGLVAARRAKGRLTLRAMNCCQNLNPKPSTPKPQPQNPNSKPFNPQQVQPGRDTDAKSGNNTPLLPPTEATGVRRTCLLVLTRAR